MNKPVHHAHGSARGGARGRARGGTRGGARGGGRGRARGGADTANAHLIEEQAEPVQLAPNILAEPEQLATPTHLPYEAAQTEKGKWIYKVYVGAGPKGRWKPSESFTPKELGSDHFQRLRNDAVAARRVAVAMRVPMRGSASTPLYQRGLPSSGQSSTTPTKILPM